MNHNDQTKELSSLLWPQDPSDLCPAPAPTPEQMAALHESKTFKGPLATFAGQEIPAKPIPITTPPVAITTTKPHAPRQTREQRARALVTDGAVLLPDLPVAGIVFALQHGGVIPVRSQSDPRILYQTNGVCQCRDYERHSEDDPKWLCKHRLAAKYALLARLEEEISDAPSPTRKGAPPWTVGEESREEVPQP